MNEPKPKKSLGQHWLHDEHTLQQIVDLAGLSRGEKALEIGPGLGTLTEVLLRAGADVTAVECDRELYEDLLAWSNSLAAEDSSRLEVIRQDILEYRLDLLPPNYKVIANIPYYLTSNLIRLLGETDNRPLRAVVLIQKEVAERLCACSLGPVVPDRLFMPPPKVDSQVLILDRLNSPQVTSSNLKQLTKLTKAGFSNKRKTLHNSLAAGLHISKDEAKQLLHKAGLAASARPQELSTAQWLKLADVI